MIVRLVVLAAALVVVVLAVGWRADVADCTTARQQAVAAAVGRPIPGGAMKLEERLERSCPASGDLAGAAGALLSKGYDAAAARLLDTAVRRSPDDWSAWYGLSVLLRTRGKTDEANLALLRAHDLNPRYAPAQPQLRGAGAAGSQSATTAPD